MPTPPRSLTTTELQRGLLAVRTLLSPRFEDFIVDSTRRDLEDALEVLEAEETERKNLGSVPK